jgi:cell division protein FtsB
LETVTKPEAPAKPDSFRPVLGAAVVLFMVLLALAGLKSYRDLSAARERERVLETGIEDMRARSARLRTRIERLRNDPGTLERRAREDLGMVRPGDVIIELPADGAVPAKAPMPAPPPPAPAPPLPPSTPVAASGSGAGVAPAQNP